MKKPLLRTILFVIILAIAGVWIYQQMTKNSLNTSGEIGFSPPMGASDMRMDDGNTGFYKGDQLEKQFDNTRSSMQLNATPALSPSTSPTQPQTDRLILKTGNISMVVQDVAEAIQKIEKFAQEKNGFVVSSQIYSTEIPNGQISIRIPSERFDETIVSIGEYGTVKQKEINGEDVTEEFIDISAQLKNLQATEEQLLAILKKAQKVEDILAVQRELSQIRTNIERIQGRIKFLQESARLSLLTIYLSTDSEGLSLLNEYAPWKPVGVAKQAIRSLIDAGKGFVNLVIWIVIYIPVWGLLALILWYGTRLVRKWRKRR